MKKLNQIILTRRILFYSIILVVFSFGQTAPIAVLALSPEQRNVFDSGVDFFNVERDGAIQCLSTIYPSSPGNGASGGSYTLDQLKTFAYTPINSTWNISDSTVEQWFLKQSGARPVITKYGLTSSNIGTITPAIKAAGVSPVFFYAYTVSEGGGAGGFINHFGSDVAGGGVANAKRDVEYLAEQSKIMTSKPSWVDAGNPVDFVPKEVQDAGNADFQNMPSGTIGRAYIPATAAAAWEVYYPNGLKKEYNKVQDYGTPLENAMKNIQSMGGDPLQGGASIGTSGGTNCTPGFLMGEGIAKAINWAVMIAKNEGYGYDIPTRETGWVKWRSDPNCTVNCGSLDCSSFVSAALTVAGYFTTNPNFSTFNEASVLTGAGFKQVASSAATSAGLLPGDILLADGHTAMYIGNNQIVHASINENGTTEGGQVGDQTGKEIVIRDFYDKPWNGVFRAHN